MANRRMFSMDIVGADKFLDMPASAQALYFHLGMRADDDGFLASPVSVLRMIGSCKDDLTLLAAKGFVIPFASGVCVIRHWGINNYIQSDRYHPTIHAEEKAQLVKTRNTYDFPASTGDNFVSRLDTTCTQPVSILDTEVRLGYIEEYPNGYSPLEPAGSGAEKEASPKRKPPQYAPASKHYRAAKWLADDCQKTQASFRYPSEASLQQQADALRKLEELDGVPWEQVRETLMFARADDFWQANTQSAVPFRKKYNQIRGALERAGRAKHPQQQEPQHIPALGEGLVYDD